MLHYLILTQKYASILISKTLDKGNFGNFIYQIQIIFSAFIFNICKNSMLLKNSSRLYFFF